MEKNVYKMWFYGDKASSDLWFIESSLLITIYSSFSHHKWTMDMGGPYIVKMALLVQCQ